MESFFALVGFVLSVCLLIGFFTAVNYLGEIRDFARQQVTLLKQHTALLERIEHHVRPVEPPVVMPACPPATDAQKGPPSGVLFIEPSSGIGAGVVIGLLAVLVIGIALYLILG